MKIEWVLEQDDLRRWRELVRVNETKSLPQERAALNVRREGIDLSKRAIWRGIVGCQVTTQQRSGPDSIASKFLRSGSDILQIQKLGRSEQPLKFMERELSAAGLRRGKLIAENLATILANLNSGEWKSLLENLETLRNYTTLKKERFVVEYLQSGKYPGLGPKQSRNLVQWLGLSRYEIPIDSRVLKCMKELGVGFVPSGRALSDESVYILVQDGLQKIASELEIYPCMLDAYMFASFDGDLENNDTFN